MERLQSYRNGKWKERTLNEIIKGDIIMKGPAKLLFIVTNVHKGDRDTPTSLSLEMINKQPSIWGVWED